MKAFFFFPPLEPPNVGAIWNIGSQAVKKTKDILKFLVQQKEPQLSYYNQAFTETTHQTGSSRSRSAKKGIPRTKFITCLVIFPESTTTRVYSVVWTYTVSKLQLCAFFADCDMSRRQAATINQYPFLTLTLLWTTSLRKRWKWEGAHRLYTCMAAEIIF